MDRVATIRHLTNALTAAELLVQNHVATIERQQQSLEEVTALDEEHVAAIKRLQDAIERANALDQDRVATIQRLQQTLDDAYMLDKDRVAAIHRLEKAMERDRQAEQIDGMLINFRHTSFLAEPAFADAWSKAVKANIEGWPGGVPDLRWRAHVAVWAARKGLSLEGDFVECGVHTGLLSLTVYHALNFASIDRRFFLFDTFDGIPLIGLEGPELERAKLANEQIYRNVWAYTERNFSGFANARLVKGELPDSLNTVRIERIAYLSIDLNAAAYERATIEQLWERLVSGSVVLIDDYIWVGHEAQYKMWNRFAERKQVPIVALPTGQGIIIKP
jgi:O-methyltransferase